jgi:hypothetical protein
MRTNNEEGNPARLIVREGANENVVATMKNMPFPFIRREFVAIQVCASDDSNGDLLFAGESVDESVDYGTNFKAVRGTVHAVARLRSVSPNTCRLTIFQSIDPGGRIPAWVINMKVAEALGVAEETRLSFDRSDEVDKTALDALAGVIEREHQVYEDEENAVVDRVRDQLDEIPNSSLEELESPDHRVCMEGFYKGGTVIARAATVLDEDICTCAAWAFQLMARHFVKDFYADGGMERGVTTHNDHSFTGQLLMDLNIPTFSPREFVTRSVWRWKSETVLLVASESCLVDQYPIRAGIVRGSTTTLHKFERLDLLGEIPQTRVTWTRQPDLGGLIPTRAVRGAGIKMMMYVRRMRSAEATVTPTPNTQ